MQITISCISEKPIRFAHYLESSEHKLFLIYLQI